MEGNRDFRSSGTDPEQYAQMKTLLQKYPDITEEEDAELSQYLRKGPMLGRALLSTAELQANLAQFTKDHKREFSLSKNGYVLVAVIALALILGALLLNGIGA